VDKLIARFGWLDRELAQRWASTYGSRTWRLLDGLQWQNELGEHLGAGLYTREVDYLRREEWAVEAEDILWRRTKLGLFMTPGQQAKLRDYLQASRQPQPLASARAV
jgi:glycerol-3-phosphate dehydrogenase